MPRPEDYGHKGPDQDLMARLRAAVGATADHTQYEYTYRSSEPARMVASHIGSMSGDFILRLIAANRPLLLLAGAVGAGTLGAAFMAQAVARAVGTPQGLMAAYVTLVSVSGVVAAVAINAAGEPVWAMRLEGAVPLQEAVEAGEIKVD